MSNIMSNFIQNAYTYCTWRNVCHSTWGKMDDGSIAMLKTDCISYPLHQWVSLYRKRVRRGIPWHGQSLTNYTSHCYNIPSYTGSGQLEREHVGKGWDAWSRNWWKKISEWVAMGENSPMYMVIIQMTMTRRSTAPSMFHAQKQKNTE